MMERTTLVLAVVLVLTSTGMAATADEAARHLQAIETNITAMERAGLTTQQVEDLQHDARLAYGRSDHDRVIEISRQVAEIQQQAILALDSVTAFNRTIQEAAADGIKTGAARASLKEARQDLEAGRFTEAVETIDAARSELEARRAERQLDRLYADTSTVIEQYREEILAGAAVLLVIGGLGYILTRRYRRRRRELDLRARRTALEDLLKETQRRYYEDEEISKRVFEQRSETYREMLQETEDELEGFGPD